MERIFVFMLFLIAFGAFGWFVVVSQVLSGLVSGNPPRPSEVSAEQDFIPKLYDQLKQTIEETGAVAQILSEKTPDDGHFFWGSVATNTGRSCVGSMTSAYWATSFALSDQSGIRYPAQKKFYGCNDFFRTVPPEIPVRLLDFGEVDKPVRHLCSAVLAEGVNRVWENTEKPLAHLSIATVFQGLSIEDMVARAAEKREVVQVGGDTAGTTFTTSDLFASAKVTPVGTFTCEGFDVFHVSIEALHRPLTE